MLTDPDLPWIEAPTLDSSDEPEATVQEVLEVCRDLLGSGPDLNRLTVAFWLLKDEQVCGDYLAVHLEAMLEATLETWLNATSCERCDPVASQKPRRGDRLAWLDYCAAALQSGLELPVPHCPALEFAGCREYRPTKAIALGCPSCGVSSWVAIAPAHLNRHPFYVSEADAVACSARCVLDAVRVAEEPRRVGRRPNRWEPQSG